MENAAREAKNKYLREWRKQHKDKVKVYNETYWERKAKENQSNVI